MNLGSYKDHPLIQLPLSVFRLPGYLWRRKPLLIAVLIIALLGALYAFGFRIGPGLTFSRVGTLVLTNLPQGALVFVNEALHKTAKEPEMRITLLPGTHSILVGTDIHHPWNELVSVPAGEEVNVRPIFVAKSAAETMLHEADADRGNLLIDELSLPTKDAPLRLYSGCGLVYAERNRIIAQATTTSSCAPPAFLCDEGNCDAPTLVLTPPSELRAIIPFPGRDDAVIYVAGKDVNALEVDPRYPQFFAPILKEGRPEIAPWSESAIVVRELGAVFTVTFP